MTAKQTKEMRGYSKNTLDITWARYPNERPWEMVNRWHNKCPNIDLDLSSPQRIAGMDKTQGNWICPKSRSGKHGEEGKTSTSHALGAKRAYAFLFNPVEGWRAMFCPYYVVDGKLKFADGTIVEKWDGVLPDRGEETVEEFWERSKIKAIEARSAWQLSVGAQAEAHAEDQLTPRQKADKKKQEELNKKAEEKHKKLVAEAGMVTEASLEKEE